MTLLEVTKLVEGKYPSEDAKEKKMRFVTQEELNEFRQYLAIDPAYLEALNNTANSDEFFNACPLFQAIPKDLREDLFYAVKLGFTYKNVPSRLVYLLRIALREAKSPNLAIEMLNNAQFHKYLKASALPEGVTVKQIMSNLLGHDFKTFTNARKRVEYKGFYEYYVADADRVLILPEDIAKQVSSREDINGLNYKPDVGVCLYDKPLRFFNGRLGITTDEFDLRECI